MPRFAGPTAADSAPGSLRAPMPGVVTRLHVAEGEQVAAGAPVATLEAMKMQPEIRAPVDGVVAQLDTRPGQQVDAGTILAVIAPTPSAESDGIAGESDTNLQMRHSERSASGESA